MNYLLEPEVNTKEVLAHGYPPTDARVKELLPAEMVNDPVLYPAVELLTAGIRRGGASPMRSARN